MRWMFNDVWMNDKFTHIKVNDNFKITTLQQMVNGNILTKNKQNNSINGIIVIGNKKCFYKVQEIKSYFMMVIPETIHKLKRLLDDGITEQSQKEIFKLTVLVMKVYLIDTYNIIPQSYRSVMELFNYLTGVNTIEPNVVTHEYNFSNVKEFSIKVISYVSNQK